MSEYWGTGVAPTKLGTSNKMSAPYQAVKARDGYFVMGATNQKLWAKLCALLDRPDLVEHAEYATVSLRLKHREALIVAPEVEFAKRDSEDFRVCSEGSRFGAPIAKTLSNTLSSRNIARLQAALGVPRVKRMLPQAVCAQGELQTAAHALTDRLMGLSPGTHKAVKESIHRVVVEQRLDDDDIVQEVYGGQAFRDGVAAFNGN